MDSLRILPETPVVDQLGWTLLHFLWQGSVVVLLAGSIFYLMRRASANLRYLFGLLSMCLMAACPMITFWSILSLPSAMAEKASLAVGQVSRIDTTVFSQSETPSLSKGTDLPQTSRRTPAEIRSRQSPELPVRDRGITRETSPVRSNAAWMTPLLDRLRVVLPWMVGAWMVGVGILSIRMLGGWVVLCKLKEHGTRCVDPHLQSVLLRLCDRMGISRAIELIDSVSVRVPSVYGWIRPVILLPPCAVTGLGPLEMEALLAHELAHIRRFDYLVNLFQVAIETLLFYHPAVWWLSKRVRQERENCCDDIAVEKLGDRMTYVRALSRVAAFEAELPKLTTAATGGELMGRIQRLVGVSTRDSAAQRGGLAGAVLLVSLVAGLAVLMLRPGGMIAEEARSAVKQKENSTDVRERSKDRSESDSAPDRKSVSDSDKPRVETPETPVKKGPKVTASGTVVDPNGKPLAGVKVYLREWSTYRISEDHYNLNPRDAFSSSVTDASGHFRFKDVASPAFRIFDSDPSRWDVVAVADGYALTWRHLPKAINEEPMTLKLTAESTISGQLLDEKGRAIVGARVRVEQISSLDNRIWGPRGDPTNLDLQRSQLSPRATSDVTGRFTIHGVPENSRATLIVKHDEFEREFAYAATTNDPQPDLEGLYTTSADGKRTRTMHKVHVGDFKLTLKPGRRIDGRVVFGDSSKPSPFAQVSLTWNRKWNYTTADAEGRFTIFGLPDAKFKVSGIPIENEKYLTGSTEVSFENDQRKAVVEVRLPVGQIVSGIVVAEDTEKGIFGVQVGYIANSLPEQKSATSRSTTTTGADGKFRLTVPSGLGTVTILGPVEDYFIPNRYYVRTANKDLKQKITNQFRREVEVKSGQALEGLRFSVDRGVVIRGFVKDGDGRPVAGAEVKRPRGSGGRIKNRTTQTDNNGRFLLSGFPPEVEQRLEIVHRKRKLRGTTVVKPENPIQKQIEFEIQLKPTASLTGRAELDGEPLAGAKTSLYMRDINRGRQISRPVAETVTDREGRYKFDLIEPGRDYSVHIFRTQQDFENTRTITLKPSQNGELPVIKFQRLDMSVSGVVVDPNGKPVEGVVVSARNRRTGRQLSVQFRKRQKSIMTDNQGRFTLKYLPNAPLTLMAYIKPPPGENRTRFPANVDVEAGETDVRIVLDPKLVRGR